MDPIAEMRQGILINCLANQVPITGELYFALVFRTKSELIKICRELHIQIPKEEN